MFGHKDFFLKSRWCWCSKFFFRAKERSNPLLESWFFYLRWNFIRFLILWCYNTLRMIDCCAYDLGCADTKASDQQAHQNNEPPPQDSFWKIFLNIIVKDFVIVSSVEKIALLLLMLNARKQKLCENKHCKTICFDHNVKDISLKYFQRFITLLIWMIYSKIIAKICNF